MRDADARAIMRDADASPEQWLRAADWLGQLPVLAPWREVPARSVRVAAALLSRHGGWGDGFLMPGWVVGDRVTIDLPALAVEGREDPHGSAWEAYADAFAANVLAAMERSEPTAPPQGQAPVSTWGGTRAPSKGARRRARRSRRRHRG